MIHRGLSRFGVLASFLLLSIACGPLPGRNATSSSQSTKTAVLAVTSGPQIYIAQSASGSDTGVDCADAHAYTWFNNPANWGSNPGQVSPGTGVHICGTVMGAPGDQALAFQGGGTSMSPIALVFEPGANLTAPYWSSSGAITTNGYSWIVIDGDVNGGRQGIIQNTLNGTAGGMCPGGACLYQQSSIAINANGSANCIVENLTFANIYVHSSMSDTAISGEVQAIQYNNSDFLTINNILAHDVHWAIAGYGNNVIFSNSEIYNMDHGFAEGYNYSGTLVGPTIFNNHFHDSAAWDTTNDYYHHDYIHVWSLGGGVVTGTKIYNNLFDGDPGSCCVTANVYLETVSGSPASTAVSNSEIFNNVILPPSVARDYHGIWFDSTTAANTSNAVYNNLINTGGNTYSSVIAMGQTQFTFQNNIVMISGYGANEITLDRGTTVADVDDNIYESTVNGNTFTWDTTFTSSLADWQNLCGCDLHAQVVSSNQINVTADGHLNSGSVAIGAGANLMALGITALDYDKAGAARSPSGAWDAGAYNYGSSTSVAPSPTPYPSSSPSPSPSPSATSSCTNQAFVSGSISPNPVTVGGSFNVYCDYGVQATAIDTNLDGTFVAGSCTWVSFSGTVAVFNCTAGQTPGTYPISCSLGVVSTNQYCPETNSIGNLQVVAVSNSPSPSPSPALTDTTAPSTTIFSPVNGQTVTRHSTVAIQATASDDVGVTSVQFLVNGSVVCTDLGANVGGNVQADYSCNWSVPGKPGAIYQLQTKANDASGNIGLSPLVSVMAK